MEEVREKMWHHEHGGKGHHDDSDLYLALPGSFNPLFSVVFHEDCMSNTRKYNECTCDSHALNIPSVIDIERVGYHYVMPVVCSLGVLLNLMVIYVLSRKLYWAPSFIFLRGLALADFLTTSITFVYGVTYCFNCPNTTAGFLRTFYQVNDISL